MNLENYERNCFHIKNVLLSKICLRCKISVKVLLTPEAIYSVAPEITAMTWCLVLWPNIVLNCKTTVESQHYWFLRAFYWQQIYHVFLVFSFQAEFAQNKNNIDLPSYEFMTKTRPFCGGGGGWRWEEYPLFVPSLVSDTTCSWNVDEWIKKRYRDYYVIRIFNKG